MQELKKKKRGRPSVTSKLYTDRDYVEGIISNGMNYRSYRTISDMAYVYAAISILKEAASEINELEVICSKDYDCRSILNQLGRMRWQNGFGKESVVKIANTAIKAKKDGYTVKEIEKYIRNGRINDKW